MSTWKLLISCLAIMAATTFTDTFSTVITMLSYSTTSPLLRASTITTRALSVDDQPVTKLRKYDQSGIEMVHFSTPKDENRLLVFDGETFKAFSLGKEKALSFRYVTAIPLMVHALKTTLPERFKPGQPHFQMLWSIDDLLFTQCVNEGVDCSYTEFYPPLISFSTVYRDERILPTAKAFPNPHFITCLYKWKVSGIETCTWQEVDKSLQWEDLTPTILWRGSDFLQFLPTYDVHKSVEKHWIRDKGHLSKMKSMTKSQVVDELMDHWYDLTPRWRAVALTLKVKLANNTSSPWIDVMFTGSHEEKVHEAFSDIGLPVAEDMPMDGKTMSRARYQIDFGGGGGTTWQGTLAKLQMPGVLFHHETPTKDWFYDRMEPWVHYIPVGTGLEDLFKQFKWAEDHPEVAKNISKAATKLAEELLSLDNMEKTYQDLFVTYLSEVVEAYHPPEGSWEECVARYNKHNIGVHEIAVCRGEKCHQEYAPNTYLDEY